MVTAQPIGKYLCYSMYPIAKSAQNWVRPKHVQNVFPICTACQKNRKWKDIYYAIVFGCGTSRYDFITKSLILIANERLKVESQDHCMVCWYPFPFGLNKKVVTVRPMQQFISKVKGLS